LKEPRVRLESSVTSVSWIPSEAIKGMVKAPFELGVGHYDSAPPDEIDLTALERMRDDDRFRFANHLGAWIEVENGRIVDCGQWGEGLLNSTHMHFGPKEIVFQAAGFPDIRPEPKVTSRSATFVQTAGGRPGMPAPRRVRRKPFVQLVGPTVWTTLRLTLHADGSAESKLAGATTFPRHWVYDAMGKLFQKSGMIDFKDWYHGVFGKKGTPWGNQDSPAFVTMAESALERQLSNTIMRDGAKPKLRRLRTGRVLTKQGDPGDELFLVLDGVLSVEVDGRVLAELGPGAIIGERAFLEGGRRTSTVRALTPVKLAVARVAQIDVGALRQLATTHRREERG
jgi:hypothetical protein